MDVVSLERLGDASIFDCARRVLGELIEVVDDLPQLSSEGLLFFRRKAEPC